METPNTKPELSKKEKFKKEEKSYAIIIFSLLAFRSTFFEPFRIPSDSLNPTLLTGDFLLVNKFSYGFKLPFSDWFNTNPTYLTGPQRPERGDVIVFKYPRDISLDYIKRVIGLPGDTVEMIDKVVYVNGAPIIAKEVDDKELRDSLDNRYKSYNFKQFQNKTGGHTHYTQIDMNATYSVNTPKFTVPHDNYFVMGDNRDLSGDSRMWGFVPFGHIKGKAFLIWFSLSFPWPWQMGNPESEEFHFRPWRIGSLIP